MEFLKKNLKTVITSAIFIAGILAIGIYNILCVQVVEAKRSSYTRTGFDYIIELPSESELAAIKGGSGVESVYPFHLYTNLFVSQPGVKAFVSTSRYEKNERIGFLGDKTLIKGSFDGEGAVIDETAVSALGATVGDTVSFVWGKGSGRKTVSQKVKAVCLACSYNLYTDGIVLLDYTDEMKSVYDIKNETYVFTGAFVKASGAECYATIKSALDESRNVEAKADLYVTNAKHKTDRLEKQVSSINVGVALAIAIFYSALGALFIIINRNSDKAERDGGMPKQKMFSSYLIGGSVCAAAVTAITFAVLLVVGIATHFIADAIATVLAMSLPALVAIPVTWAVSKIYTDRLYANRSKEVASDSLRG